MGKPYSWKQAVWESQLPSTTKLVLAALGSHLNDMGDSMFPSQKRLAQLCSLTESALLFEPSGHCSTVGPGMEGIHGEVEAKSFPLGVI